MTLQELYEAVKKLTDGEVRTSYHIDDFWKGKPHFTVTVKYNVKKCDCCNSEKSEEIFVSEETAEKTLIKFTEQFNARMGK